EMELVIENDQGFAGFITDDDYRVRIAAQPTMTGGVEYFVRDDASGSWTPFQSIGLEDSLTTSPVGFSKTGRVLYMLDSRDRNTAALMARDVRSGESRVLAEDDLTDIGAVLMHPTERTVQAVSTNYKRQKWKILDESIAEDFSYLRRVADGDFSISSRTLDDREWIVAYVLDDGPVRYYHYDRDARSADFLFTNRSALDDLPLARMHPVIIKARDGLDLVSYYTLPVWADDEGDGLPEKPLATVLLVHGGPWGRDAWGYNPIHQWLANRGYAVLSVNFRGSTGFGKDFINAGNLAWATTMHDDLIDAVDWAIAQGISDPDRVAIMGGSYGGYATLVGLTFTPEKFAAGVDIVGPSNLITLLNSIPPYWTSFRDQFRKRVGDIDSPEGRIMLRSRSPLTHVEEIVKPLLIGQGANDPRVKEAESQQIVEAMQEKNIPVTYVRYPDEGHGFARPQNRLSFFAVAEIFLAQHLGGVYEEIGDDFRGSSIEIPVGAEEVPGTTEAIAR
ncbi:MAG: S9 family peptidase, partial [Planctomycetota bacterium]